MVLNGHWKRTCNFEDEHCQQMKKLFYENMDETPQPPRPMAINAMAKQYHNSVTQSSLNSMIARVLSENSIYINGS